MRPVLWLLLASAMLTGTVAAQVPEGASQQVPRRVGGNIKPPTLLKQVHAEYPFDTQSGFREGVVVLDVTIDPQGRVGKAEAIWGRVPFREAALAAVKQWRFTPTLVDGVAVPIIVTVRFEFFLGGEGSSRAFSPMI